MSCIHNSWQPPVGNNLFAAAASVVSTGHGAAHREGPHNALAQEADIRLIIFVSTTYVVRGIGLSIRVICHYAAPCMLSYIVSVPKLIYMPYAKWHQQFHVVDARSSCSSNEPWMILLHFVFKHGKKWQEVMCASRIHRGWKSILWMMPLVSIYLQSCSVCKFCSRSRLSLRCYGGRSEV